MDGNNVEMNYSNFFDGNSKVHVVSRIVPASTSITAGEIVNKGVNTGEIAKVGTTPIPADAYGIALESVSTGTGETASVGILVEGAFNMNKIIYPAGKSLTDYEIPLRNIGITLCDIVNSELPQ